MMASQFYWGRKQDMPAEYHEKPLTCN